MAYNLPRHLDHSTPSSRVHNTAAAELDALAWSITLRRVRSTLYIEGFVPRNVDLVIPWEIVSGGINRGNWSPGLHQTINVTQAGTYLMLLTVRFSQAQPQWASEDGRRWARIMLNGTSPLSNTIGQNCEAFGDPGYGTTVQALAVRSLQAGDILYCGYRTSHQNSPLPGIDALNQDLGGTYFTMTRIGPGPGALTADLVGGGGGVPRLESGALPPEDPLNFFATAIDNLGVCARPRRTSTFTVTDNTNKTISWNFDGVDTRGDMWDPAEPSKVTIRVAGTYLFELRVRFPPGAGAGTGYRAALIYKNGTDGASAVACDPRRAQGTYEGTTCLTRAIVRCDVGDVLIASAAVYEAGQSVTVGAADAGGTYLFAARIGRSGDGGSVISGQEFDTGPVPDDLREVREGPLGGPIRDGGIAA